MVLQERGWVVKHLNEPSQHSRWSSSRPRTTFSAGPAVRCSLPRAGYRVVTPTRSIADFHNVGDERKTGVAGATGHFPASWCREDDRGRLEAAVPIVRKRGP